MRGYGVVDGFVGAEVVGPGIVVCGAWGPAGVWVLVEVRV